MLFLILATQNITLPVLRAGSLKPDFAAQMNEGGSAATKVKLVISPEGVPVRCDVAFSNGPQANGEALCAMLRREARYSPALDENGKAIAGITFVWSQWKQGKWLGAAAPDWDPVEVGLQVNKIPPGFYEMQTFHLRLVVDPTGIVKRCEVEEARLSAQAQQLLCREVNRENIPPALDENGKAIDAVRPVRVRLTSEAYDKKLMRRLRGY